MYYYGYIGNVDKQCRKICDCLGYGSNNTAHLLIHETACAETGAGNIKDGTVFAGMGFTQFDKKPFYSIKKRAMKYRKKIKKDLKIDIYYVEWEHLRYNVFLSLLFCRLYYLLKKPPVPADLKGRAKYWKKYYNTFLGKGTANHYIKMVARYYMNGDTL